MNTPNAFLILYNVVASLGYLFVFLRYFIMAVAVVWTIIALLNIWGLTTAHSNGQMNKLFPSQAQPTMASAWFQLFIAGALFVLALNLLPATLFSAILTGSTDAVQNYSVGSYNPDPTASQIQSLTKGLIQSLMALIGLLAFYRGFVTWWQISQGTSNQGMSRVLGFFVFGALAFNFFWVNDLLANITGMNFLKAILG